MLYLFLVDSKPSSQRNYHRLVSLIVDVSQFVLWKYIEDQELGSGNFESYLNTVGTKHTIFHLYKNILCCKCKMKKIVKEKIISEKQFTMLYRRDVEQSVREHKKYSGEKLFQTCICCYSAVQNVNLRVLDITLAKILINKCGKPAPLGLDVWLSTITEIRNEIFHLSDRQEMTDDKFHRNWQKLEGSIIGIANLVQNDLPKDIRGKIENVKQLVVFSDQELKNERLCRDYWMYKCSTFEVLFIYLRHLELLFQ